MVALFSFSQTFAIEKQLDIRSIRHYIDRFLHSLLIVPMTYDISLEGISIDPSVPHDLMGKESVFGDSHSIGHSAPTIVFFPTMMGISIAEHNFHTSTADTCACTWPFAPVVVPTADKFDCKFILIVVVCVGWLPVMERTCALLMVRIAVAVPILTQSFITTILHCPHGVFLALVDVEHLTSIFCLINI